MPYNEAKRPFALTIAGFDPCGGAGLLADIKTMESYQVYGQAVCTAVTLQNERQFVEPGWLPWERIEAQLVVLAAARSFSFIKIGLVENAEILGRILQWVRKQWPESFVLWDPIVRASAGFTFHAEADRVGLTALLRKVNLVTPNLPEAEFLTGLQGAAALEELEKSTDVLLKGGHGDDPDTSLDILALDGVRHEMRGHRFVGVERHGSGCTMSAALLANLAQGRDVVSAAEIAKQHMHRFFRNGDGRLGYIT